MSSEIEAIATKSAAEVGRLIASGAVDPVELTEFYLARAATRDDVYVRLTPERARRAAAAARERARAGLRRGPLDGVPVSWKDLVDLAGSPTEGGSKLLEGRTPERDAEVVRRADAVGLVPLGKTHLSELAFSGLGFNPMTKTAPNPFDEARAPGGSSSGAAASVTFGMAAAAIGSDTGGSVRIPSAWHGLVGLKTTAGRVPNDGVTPLSPTLDTIGPLCRTVEDAGLLFAILDGSPAADLKGATLRNRRFFIPETIVFDEIEDDLRAAFEASVERLAAAGAQIARGPVPEFAEALEIAATEGAIVNTEGYAVWKDVIEAAPDKMFAQVRERFRGGAAFTADQIDRARLAFARLKKSFLARTAEADAVLAPTTPNHAPKIAEIAADDALYVSENLKALRNTRLGNILELCSLALPAGTTALGHPSSLMLSGPPNAEARLLRLGAGVEAALS